MDTFADETWTVTKVGDDVFQPLRIGVHAYTGVVDNAVTASVDHEVDVEALPTEKPRTPIPDNQGKGWTVPTDSSANSGIHIRPILMIHTEPPQFSATQLLRFLEWIQRVDPSQKRETTS